MKEPSGKGKQETKRRTIVFWPRRLQRPSVETVVVDTRSFVDFSRPVIAAHPVSGSDDELLNATRHALLASSTARLTQLYNSLEPILSQPAAIYHGSLAGSSWHHGEHYNCYWIGDVNHVIQRSDLTENERERLQTAARRLGSEGKVVYAIATSVEQHTKTTNPHAFKPHDLNCLGLISHDIHLYPDITRSLQLFKQQGIDVIYASCDDELLVSAVAHKARLVSKLTLPDRFHPGIPLEHSNSCYAELSLEARKKLIAQLDPRTTLVSDEPLPSIVHTVKIN